MLRRLALLTAAVSIGACSDTDTAHAPPQKPPPKPATSAAAAPASAATSAAAHESTRADAEVTTGALDGAAWRIDLPRAWNHGLVVWFHGYETGPTRLPAGDPLAPQLQQLVARGYAVAQSGYSQSGWAVEQGAADSERLRQLFTERHGKPEQTFAVGMSMGGTLTVMAIETQPDVYAGALSLCGAIEPSDALLQGDFALVAAFNYYFPGLLGPWQPVPEDFAPDAAAAAKIAAAFKSKPEAAQSLLRLWGVGDLHTLADVLAFDYFEIGELQRRTHGNPFDNADRIYTGTRDDAALNDGVTRVRADGPAAAYLARWYTPSGDLKHPLLALHDTGDPLVPASSAYSYSLAVARTGHADNFVQQYVNKDGHCVFTPQEVGRAFDELVAWVHSGQRPPSGRLPGGGGQK